MLAGACEKDNSGKRKKNNKTKTMMHRRGRRRRGIESLGKGAQETDREAGGREGVWR